MKYRSLSKSAFAVTVMIALAAAACANSAEVPPEEVTAPTEPAPAETKIPASTPANNKPAEKKCAPSCKTDSDCTNSCPALEKGVQCCDAKTNTCWGAKTSACPKPEPQNPDPPPAY